MLTLLKLNLSSKRRCYWVVLAAEPFALVVALVLGWDFLPWRLCFFLPEVLGALVWLPPVVSALGRSPVPVFVWLSPVPTVVGFVPGTGPAGVPVAGGGGACANETPTVPNIKPAARSAANLDWLFISISPCA